MAEKESFDFNNDHGDHILAKAYVPEHIPALMVAISKAAPFLVENYLGYTKDNWVIFIGYPLDRKFQGDNCERIIDDLLEKYQPEYFWFIGPALPKSFEQNCRNRQSDHYYSLNLDRFRIKPALRRQINRASEKLDIDSSRIFSSEHQMLVDELLGRQDLPPMIEQLYRSMVDYVEFCDTGCVLDARDKRGNLTAFFVVETAAQDFDTYLLGCHSKINYVPHASDLLFSKMIECTRERGKNTINLGLGVNDGIRRFKTKWGGVPILTYEFCECYCGPPPQIAILDQLIKGGF